MKKLILTVALALFGFTASAQSSGVYTYKFEDRKTLIIGQWVRFKGLNQKDRITFLDKTEKAKNELFLILELHGFGFEDAIVEEDGDHVWAIDMENGFVLYVIYGENNVLKDYSQIVLITQKL